MVAGGAVPVAIVLGLSMTLLQFAIGTVNDLVDAPRDAGHKPGKPIPAGLVTVRGARVVAVGSAVAGLVLAFVGGPWLVALAAVVLAIGLAYDLWAKGTTLSWLPFALGIPLLPVYGWYGATGSLPELFLVLVPAAANAGAALAVANAMVDTERDEAAGVRSIALALGPTRARMAGRRAQRRGRRAGARHGGRPRGAVGLGGRDPARRGRAHGRGRAGARGSGPAGHVVARARLGDPGDRDGAPGGRVAGGAERLDGDRPRRLTAPPLAPGPGWCVHAHPTVRGPVPEGTPNGRPRAARYGR